MAYLLNCSSGLTGLHYAARNGALEAVLVLVEYGADVNARSNSGASPLHRAAYMGHEKIVEVLLGKALSIMSTRV